MPNNEFDLGTPNNVREVFGDDKLLWLLPVYTSKGDGYTFPRAIAAAADQLDTITVTVHGGEEDEHTN